MITRRKTVLGAAAMLMAAPALAQESAWPSRPIRIVIPTAPGGSPDITARLLGEKISPRLGQPFVVESMTAGGGVSGLQLVSKTPDGHTFSMMTGGFATQAATLKNLPYDPLNDFAYITTVVRYPMVYSVAPDSPIKSFKDMIDRARANPNKVSYGIVGAGNVYHLLGKWIDNAAGVEMNAVPYRGTALALQDVLGGRVDVLSDASTSSIPRIRSGQIRALAVTSAQRYPLLPDVPTMAETLPGIVVESWLGLVAGTGTPKPVIERMNAEFRLVLGLPEVRKWAEESGVIPAPSTPEEYRERVERDIRQWTEIVVRNNITVQ